MENVRLIQFNKYRLSLIFIIVTLPLSLVFSLSTVLASGPTVQDDNYSTNEDTTLIISAALGVLANDSGSGGGGLLTAVKDSDPVSGTLVLSSTGAFTYTPALDFNGIVTFTYHANDNGGNSAPAVVTITVTAVNDAPVAVNDNYATNEDTNLIVGNLTGILANDTDVDSGTLTAVLDVPPITGTLDLITATGAFTYSPPLDLNGSITFTYFTNDAISDSLSTGIVTIVITAVNDAPTLAANAGLTVAEGSAITITNSLLQAADVDNTAVELTFTLGTTTTNGLLQRSGVPLSPANTFTQDDINQNRLTYAHNGSETITDTFDFAVDDGAGGSIITTTFSINITPVNDAPVAGNDADTTAEDTAVATNVLSNDSDVDGSPDPASVNVTGLPISGTTNVNLTNGFITYTPTQDFNGNDSYTYEVCDDGTPTPVICVTATVALTVTAVNDRPIAVNDNGSANEDAALNVSAPGVLGNDTDVDTGDTRTVTASDSASANGASVSVNNDGQYTYNPVGVSIFNALAVGESLVDTFAYTMSDSGGLTDTATVSITVNGRNDFPTAVNNTDATDEDSVLTVLAPGVLANDTDPDTTDTLTVTNNANPSVQGASVIVNLNGSYTYTPTGAAALQALDGGDTITDTFTYDITDSNGGSDTATVTVTINGVNDAPLLDNTGDMRLADIDEDDTTSWYLVNSIIASVSGDRITDVDADSGTLGEGIAVIGVENTNGVWEYSTDNRVTWLPFGAVTNLDAVLLDGLTNIRFVPNLNYNGPAGNITFRAWDKTANSNGDTGVNVSNNGGTTPYSTSFETATLTVNSVNDAPVLDNSGSMFLTNIQEDTLDPPGDRVTSIIASAGGDRITDVDAGAVEGIAVTGADNSNGAWQFSINNGIDWQNLIVADTSATLLNPQAHIRFVPDLNYNGSAGNITFRAWDQTNGGFNGATGIDVSTNNGGSAPYSAAVETATLTVISVNDVPSLDLNGAGSGTGFATSFTEDGGAVAAVDTDLSLTDVDDLQLSSATVTLTNLQDGTAESLAVTDLGSITSSYNNATGVLSLSGTDTTARYQTVLRSLTYNNASQNPTVAARIIEIVVRDPIANSNTATSIITVIAVNDAPVVDTNTGLIVNEAGSGTITNSRLKVTDVDNTTADLRYTVTTLPVNGTLFVNGSIVNLNGQFTQEDIDNNLLDYTHNGNEFTSDQFEFTVVDGTGGTIGTTTFNITINAGNDAPVLVINAGLTENEGATTTLTNGRLLVSDADNTAVQITYRLEVTPVNGTLISDTITLSVNDTFTQDDIDNNRIAYTHDGSETTSDSFTFAVEDGVGGAIGSTLFNITISPVNDAPLVDLNGNAAGSNYAATFTEDGGVIPIVASSLSVIDPDNISDLALATATLTAYPDGTAESLFVATGGTSIAASYNSGTGILTLVGPDSVVNFQTVLRSLTYNNTSQDPSGNGRTVNIIVNDGAANSAQTSSSITIVAQNDTPVLGLNTGLTLDYGQSLNITNSELQVTDVDNAATELIYTIQSIPAHGPLKLNNTTTLIVSSTFTQSDIDNNRLTYEHDKSNTTNDSFTFTVADGDGGDISTKTFNITIRPQPVVYLPLVLNNYIPDEPNDSACAAYGITLNKNYQFLPDDAEDWYVFTLNTASSLNISITNYTSTDGQLLMYKRGASCSDLQWNSAWHDPYITPSGSITLSSVAAGTYYVRIFTNNVPSNPTEYTLRVQSP